LFSDIYRFFENETIRDLVRQMTQLLDPQSFDGID